MQQTLQIESSQIATQNSALYILLNVLCSSHLAMHTGQNNKAPSPEGIYYYSATSIIQASWGQAKTFG